MFLFCVSGINDLNKPDKLAISEEDNNTTILSDEDNTPFKFHVFESTVLNLTHQDGTNMINENDETTDLNKCGNDQFGEEAPLFDCDVTQVKQLHSEHS